MIYYSLWALPKIRSHFSYQGAGGRCYLVSRLCSWFSCRLACINKIPLFKFELWTAEGLKFCVILCIFIVKRVIFWPGSIDIGQQGLRISGVSAISFVLWRLSKQGKRGVAQKMKTSSILKDLKNEIRSDVSCSPATSFRSASVFDRYGR